MIMITITITITITISFSPLTTLHSPLGVSPISVVTPSQFPIPHSKLARLGAPIFDTAIFAEWL